MGLWLQTVRKLLHRKVHKIASSFKLRSHKSEYEDTFNQPSKSDFLEETESKENTKEPQWDSVITDQDCIVCLSAKANVLIMPCMHTLLCHFCLAYMIAQQRKNQPHPNGPNPNELLIIGYGPSQMT
ncbi:hypothetical protein Ciccas_006216 [Cichlidogyrus casuarinus]|uniref:Uncharacterized protein n=1 Tax=Cichlidogyrus casuarinus TaxID=1844966 RepID=A0ABD2Q6E1_9PLAT